MQIRREIIKCIKMNDLIFFNSIPASEAKDRIYKRLGYQREITEITPRQEEEINRYIQEARELVELKGAAKRFAVTSKNSGGVVLDGSITFESKQLAGLLKECNQAVFIGVTAGRKIIEAIEQDTARLRLSRGVVLDAAAGELVDLSLDWIMNYLNQEFRRENKYLTSRRISAGYGDFLLENQAVIYQSLNLSKLGVSITEKYMLVPEKSVTAAAGIISR